MNWLRRQLSAFQFSVLTVLLLVASASAGFFSGAIKDFTFRSFGSTETFLALDLKTYLSLLVSALFSVVFVFLLIHQYLTVCKQRDVEIGTRKSSQERLREALADIDNLRVRLQMALDGLSEDEIERKMIPPKKQGTVKRTLSLLFRRQEPQPAGLITRDRSARD